MSRRTLTVGIFGYYSNGNYGDNLMACMIYRHLESIGACPVIYASDAFFRDHYRMSVVSSLESLVERADIVLLGGGGLLTPVDNRSVLVRFTNEMRDLVTLCQKSSVPMYGVSIGGNGLPIDQIEPIERRRLFAGLAYTTLRNRRDFSALESLGKPIDVFPDMVWATPRFYPSSRVASRERTRIGFNLFMRGGKARRVLEILIGQLVRIRSDWEFVFIDVNPNDVRQGGSLDLSSPERKNCRKVVLHELHAASELLGSLTFLVTNKLHVGVVAMSLGVPVVSYAGEPKTQLLFDDVGLNELCWRRNQLIQRFASCFFLPGGMTRLTRIFARLDIEAIVAGAMNHFAALTEIVDFHASNRTGVWTRPRK